MWRATGSNRSMPIKMGDLELLDMVATGGMAEVYRGRLNDRLIPIQRTVRACSSAG